MACGNEHKMWFEVFDKKFSGVMSELKARALVRQQMDDYFDKSWAEAQKWVRSDDRCAGDNCVKEKHFLEEGRSLRSEYDPLTKTGWAEGKVEIIAHVHCKEGE